MIHGANTLAIDGHSGSTKRGLHDTVVAIRSRINLTRNKMKSLRMLLANQERMDLGMLEEYQDLNDNLRGLKIFEAEFTWKRNIL